MFNSKKDLGMQRQNYKVSDQSFVALPVPPTSLISIQMYAFPTPVPYIYNS